MIYMDFMQLLDVGTKAYGTIFEDDNPIENVMPTEFFDKIGIDDPDEVFLNYVTIRFLAYHLGPGEKKNDLLRSTGMTIGEDVEIAPEVTFDPMYPEMITIEDGAFIGWNANIFCHIYDPDEEDNVELGEVTIGEDANVGGFSTVHPDTRIDGRLFNNSVAEQDVPDGEAWGGIPAEKVKEDEEDA